MEENHNKEDSNEEFKFAIRNAHNILGIGIVTCILTIMVNNPPNFNELPTWGKRLAVGSIYAFSYKAAQSFIYDTINSINLSLDLEELSSIDDVELRYRAIKDDGIDNSFIKPW